MIERLTYKDEITEENNLEDGVTMQQAVNKLADYEVKINNGSLIELPCKVGDMVWTEETVFMFAPQILPFEVKAIKLELFGDFGQATCNSSRNINEFGKTFFLTQSEAEAKLKELRELRE